MVRETRGLWGHHPHSCPQQPDSTRATIPVMLFCPAAAAGLGLGWEMGLEVSQWGWRGLQGGDKDSSG